ncbi:hypothetical protein V6U89_07040 [Micromonospora sp. CPCC 206171]|uniref:hypothetical protein n=1 Tax=Micromonospora sp. CPCC 206171 TaxID=3122405 RepID=UPI002FEE9D49
MHPGRTPEAPRGKELEDLAVALMSMSGYYLSPRLVQRPYGDDEVLELDALAVRLTGRDGATHRVVVEAKSGTSWGYSQVFKLLGQKVYLGAGHALFIVSGCEADRVDRVDDRFRGLELHAVHVPGTVRGAAAWPLWLKLADRGLIPSASPPTAAALSNAIRSASRRRLAEDTLRRAVRNSGHSAVLANAAYLIKACDDVGLMVADPGARLLALWAMRDRWWWLGQDAAEEEAQGIGGSARTPDGDRIVAEAGKSIKAYPIVQAMLLAGLRVQLDILLALTEIAIGSSSRYRLRDLPVRLALAARAVRQLPAPEAVPWLTQQTVWHWGGVLDRRDLAQLATEAGLSTDAVFSVFPVVGRLFRNWKADMPPEETLRRKSKRREQGDRPGFG